MTTITIIATILVFGAFPVALFIYALCKAASKDNWRDEV